ncbi:MAG: phosphoribosylformylglycinamidine cyclo-ligase [Acidimicrobiales bacterium]
MPVREGPAPTGLTYAEAGVDIGAGERAVDLIRPAVAATRRPEVIGGIGGFGGLFALPPGRYREPVLVAATDGVGTKLEVAKAAGRVGTVGQDLVAMCVDDLVCQGAEPLFFLDYLAVGKLDPAHAAEVIGGVAEGCRLAGCALLGGEMAEHPGSMAPGAFDLAGFAVGVVERDELIDGAAARPGDALVGLLSPGLRSNGFSLAREIIARHGLALDGPAWPGALPTLADELLAPSVIYARGVLALIAELDVHAVAHITGGGIPGNVPRVLPPGVVAVLDRRAWPVPRVMAELVRVGGLAEDEVMRVFNLGLGMVVAVPADQAGPAVKVLGEHGYEAVVVGHLEVGTPGAPAQAALVGGA